MSALFHGQSTTNPINVDSLSSSRLIYGKEWQGTQSGGELLAMKFPETIPRGALELTFGLPTAGKRLPIIRSRDVPGLQKVPPAAIVENARVMLTEAIENANSTTNRAREKRLVNPWGVKISNFGYVDLKAILFLPKIQETKVFVEGLSRLQRWIDYEVRKYDKPFAEWVSKILRDEKGIMQRKFKPSSDSEISICSLFSLVEESFVDDEVLRVVMSLFRDYYGADGCNLFIPPLQMETWRSCMSSAEVPSVTWDWEEALINSGIAEKAFAIVNMSQHWGVFCVDFVKRTITFGDSLRRPIPQDSEAAIWRWLMATGQDIRKWKSMVGQFNVSQQPPTSGSCGINAANAIERTLNPRVKQWAHEYSSRHRIRFLKLLTGYLNVG